MDYASGSPGQLLGRRLGEGARPEDEGEVVAAGDGGAAGDRDADGATDGDKGGETGEAPAERG